MLDIVVRGRWIHVNSFACSRLHHNEIFLSKILSSMRQI